MLWVWLSVAWAQPLLSSLDEVVAECEDIVVARVVDGEHPELPTLHVERAIRGDLSGVVHPTMGSGTPSLFEGKRVIAFLCDDLAWSVYAEPIVDDDLGGWLRVGGFYDFNAHLVEPSLITVAHLDALIAGQQPTWGFRGPLMALSDDGQAVVPVGPEIQVWTRRDAFGVTGLDAGMPAESVYLWPWDDDHVRVVYRSSYPHPLELVGSISEGGIQFTVREPDLLTAGEIRAYLADPSAVNNSHRVGMRWQDGEVWTWQLGGVGESGQFDSDSRSYPVTELSMAPERFVRVGDMTWELGEGLPGAEAHRRGADGTLLRELLRGPVPVTVTSGRRSGQTGHLFRIEP